MKCARFYNVLNWILGLLLCSLGVCLCAKADFGMSTLSAPAYILHLFISQFVPWYTHGMSEYVLQAVLLLITALICWKFKAKWLLSFGCSVITGFTIDLFYIILGGTQIYPSLAGRIIAYIIGTLLIAFAVACYFRTDFPIATYELSVKAIADYRHWKIDKEKLINDLVFLGVGLGLSFIFFGKLKGIGIGTVISALVNAPLIKLFGKWIDVWQKPDKNPTSEMKENE